MAEKLGSAVLELSTDDSKLRSGLGNAEKTSALSAKRMSKRFAVAAAAAAAAMAAVIGGAMVRMSAIDRQAKLAASLGTTVKSMQVLERAGELAGVSMGEIEQATIQLTKRLSQAAGGTGQAVDALDRLGLSAQALSEMPADTKIAAIQSAIEKFIPKAEQAAVASQLFGDRSGLIFTRIDSDVLRIAADDINAFGVAVSQVDAAQIEKTNDALSRMGLTWEGIGNRIAVSVAPAMERLADSFNDLFRATGPLGMAINVLFENLDRIVTISATLAGLLMGRLAISLGVAAFGVARLTFSLGLLRAAMTRTGIGAVAVLLGEIAFRMGLGREATEEITAAQYAYQDALKKYSGVSGPAARAEIAASTKAIIEETKARLESAQAVLSDVIARQKAGQALLDENPLTRGDRSAGSAGAAMAENTRLAQQEVDRLNGKIKETVAQLGELENTDPAAPIEDGAAAANGLTNALAGATAQTGMLLQFLGRISSTIVTGRARVAGLRASIAALAGGEDEATASIAKRRAELEATAAAAASVDFEGMDPALQAASVAAMQTQIDKQVELFAVTQALEAEERSRIGTLNEVTVAATGAGSAAVTLGDALVTGAVVGRNALQQYADSAAAVGKNVGDSMVGAFGRAENAISKFVETGKFDFKDFARSIIADLANIAVRSAILGPIAGALGGAFTGGGGIFGSLFHSGGLVGAGGPGRMVPASTFAQAPRMHSGGVAGLRSDEVPAILQTGETVIPRGGAGLNVTVGIEDDGKLMAIVRNEAGKVVASSIPGIMGLNQRQTSANNTNSFARGT